MAPNVVLGQGRVQPQLVAPGCQIFPGGADPSFFEGAGAVTFIKDSQNLGWQGTYAAVTDELPHEAARRPIPAVWLAVCLSKTSLRRIIRGREDYARDIPGRKVIVLTPPGESARDVIGIPASALHVFLSCDIMNEVARELLGESVGDVTVAPAFCVDDPAMMPLLGTIQQALDDPPTEARLKVDYLVRALAAHILCEQFVDARAELSSPSRPELTDRQLQLMKDYIQANLSCEISIADLADLLGASRAQFLRRFKGSTGTTPHQYVMSARVEKARELLLDAKLNLAAVAATSGFANPAHLTTVFSRFMKMTPSEYRRQLF